MFPKINLTVNLLQNGVIIPELEKVYQFETENPSEKDIETMREMIWEMLEYCGFLNHKYNQFDLELKTVHGSHYDCKDEKCPICNEEK